MKQFLDPVLARRVQFLSKYLRKFTARKNTHLKIHDHNAAFSYTNIPTTYTIYFLSLPPIYCILSCFLNLALCICLYFFIVVF